MNSCQITFEMLIDYFEGHADAVAKQRIRDHLETGCAACRSQLEWIGTFLPALHRAVSEEMPPVPAASLEYAYNLAREMPLPASPAASPLPAPESWGELLVRTARLVFDSRQPQFALGARTAANSEGQLVYSTDEYDIDLWQEQDGSDRWHLMGQVFPKLGGAALSPDKVLFSSVAGPTLAAQIEAGEFTLNQAPAGAYEVHVHLPDQQIILPEVRIGL